MQGESCQGSRAVPLSSLTFTAWSQWKWSLISLDQVLYLTEGFWVELLPSHVVEGLIWAREGQEGEDKLTCLVETHRLRVHPAPVFCFVQEMNDSSAGNQNYSPDPLCCKKKMWDFRGRDDEFSLSFYLPLPSLNRQETLTELGSLVSQEIEVPASLKAALCALHLPGTRHRDFSVRKIAVRFLCHLTAALTATPALPCATGGSWQGKGTGSCSLPRSALPGLRADYTKGSRTALSSSDAPEYFAFLSQGDSPCSNIFLRRRHSSHWWQHQEFRIFESPWVNQAEMLMQLTIPSSRTEEDWVNRAQKIYISLHVLARNGLHRQVWVNSRCPQVRDKSQSPPCLAQEGDITSFFSGNWRNKDDQGNFSIPTTVWWCPKNISYKYLFNPAEREENRLPHWGLFLCAALLGTFQK